MKRCSIGGWQDEWAGSRSWNGGDATARRGWEVACPLLTPAWWICSALTATEALSWTWPAFRHETSGKEIELYESNIKAVQVTSVWTVSGATLHPSRCWRLTSSHQTAVTFPRPSRFILPVINHCRNNVVAPSVAPAWHTPGCNGQKGCTPAKSEQQEKWRRNQRVWWQSQQKQCCWNILIVEINKIDNNYIIRHHFLRDIENNYWKQCSPCWRKIVSWPWEAEMGQSSISPEREAPLHSIRPPRLRYHQIFTSKQSAEHLIGSRCPAVTGLPTSLGSASPLLKRKPQKLDTFCLLSCPRWNRDTVVATIATSWG